MAIELEGGCRVSEMREGVPLTNGTLRIWSQVGRATGAQAISLRIMEFAPGPSPGIRNGECDGIGHRISGSPQLDRAIAWAQARMRSGGLANVRTEPVMVPVWRRGVPMPARVAAKAGGRRIG